MKCPNCYKPMKWLELFSSADWYCPCKEDTLPELPPLQTSGKDEDEWGEDTQPLGWTKLPMSQITSVADAYYQAQTWNKDHFSLGRYLHNIVFTKNTGEMETIDDKGRRWGFRKAIDGTWYYKGA